MPFDFIRRRPTLYGISAVLFVGSVIAMFVLPIRLGIDMTGGVQMEYRYTHDVSLDTVKQAVEAEKPSLTYEGKSVVNTTSVYAVTGQKLFVVETGFSRGSVPDKDFDALKTKLRDQLSKHLSDASKGDILLEKYVNIGESFGDYIKNTAYLTLLLVVIAISFYIAYAFRGSIEGISSFSFAFVTAVSLLHDVVISAGCYLVASAIFPEYRVDTFFITAMLTVLGYSINDTIVIMDRIRSNLRLPEFKKMAFGNIINTSVNETLTRSIFTPLTILIVLVALFLFGPDSLRGFILALIFGTVVGTYSSICIAAPLLSDIQHKGK